MANKIILKKTSTASKVPLSTDLEVGEIAVNLADQKLYSKNAGGTVIVVGQGVGGSGTVTSVGITPSTGVTVSGSPVTTSGNITVGLSTKLTAIENLSGAGFFTQNGSGAIAGRTIQAGTGISVAHGNGSSQDPVITNAGVTSAVAGTGISVSSATGAVTVTNTAPDQTVVLTAGTGISTSGTYPNFTIANTGVTSVSATSPIASSGGSTPTISISQSSSTTNGSLSSTDWNTFNNKYSTGSALGTPSSGTLTNCTGLPVGGISATGTPSASTYLRGDGSWATVSGGSGTVTSVGGTGTVNGITLTGTVTSSGNLTLGGTLSGVSLSTQVTGTLPIANGGTGETTRQAAINALAGAVTSGQYLRGNGTNVVMSAIQAADVPSLNQNTTGSAATFTSTTQNSQFNSVGVGTAGSGTAGEIRATNNITAFFSSDRNLKENIKDVDNALEIVCSIGSKTFDWTDEYIKQHGGDDGYFVTKQSFGVIAQDVKEVFPQAVRTREDGTLAVDYEKLAVLSFGAIKELVNRIEKLESK